ncbi:MAG: 4-hydroxyphenylacetate 3-hydroxylase N-terminal domain-containing protein, partial [Candidatus Thorarchaeota archaeon]
MVLKTGEEYQTSLQQRNPLKVYFQGELVKDPLAHPIIRASINSVALTYDLAHDSQFREIMTTKSSLTGEMINRFSHLHQSTQDLMTKVEMLRVLGQRCGTCFQRCVGLDALNAVYLTTYDVDQHHQTDYHQRFTEYVKQVQAQDWVIDGCMTDPKGDRSKRPSQQKHPDVYVHVTKQREDGVIIRGAKAHQTGAVNSHEHLIMPTLAMRNEEAEFTICCAVPADAPGITYFYGRQSSDLRRMDQSTSGYIDCGNPEFAQLGQRHLQKLQDILVRRIR